MNLTGRTILITGGAAGIGLALAQALLARRNTVIVSSRDPAKLERARQSAPSLRTMVGDITREAEMSDMLARIETEQGDLDILVNNAAILHAYDFLRETNDFAPLEDEVAANLLGTVKVTKLALPLLLRRPEAAIVIMSSAVALVPVPSLPVYSASKAAVHSLSQSLRQQLAGTAVKVTEVLPPWVDTALAAGVPGAKLSPEVVAREIISGLEHGTDEVRVGQVKALSVATRLSPGLGARLMARTTAGISKTLMTL